MSAITNSFYVEEAEEIEVYNILRTLKDDKSAGIDKIRPKDVKQNAEKFKKNSYRFS